MQKRILMLAGPNGAGKTMMARSIIAVHGKLRFLNADVIAGQLSPGHPEDASMEAGRMLLRELEECVSSAESFVLETTLAGQSYLSRIPVWQDAGYEVHLAFLSLPHPEMAIARVAARVAQGGHGIPAEVIRRRFFSGLENFRQRYVHVVDGWQLFDASGVAPILLQEGP